MCGIVGTAPPAAGVAVADFGAFMAAFVLAGFCSAPMSPPLLLLIVGPIACRPGATSCLVLCVLEGCVGCDEACVLDGAAIKT